MDCGSGTATFERVAFIGNQSRHGAGLHVFECDVTLTNVTLSGNTGEGSGAVENDAGNVTLVNVTATRNSVHGLRQNGGTMTVVDSIVAGNPTDLHTFNQCRIGFSAWGFDQPTDLEETDRSSASSMRKESARYISCSREVLRSIRGTTLPARATIGGEDPRL